MVRLSPIYLVAKTWGIHLNSAVGSVAGGTSLVPNYAFARMKYVSFPMGIFCGQTTKAVTSGCGTWTEFGEGLQGFIGFITFVFNHDLSIDFSLHVVYCTRPTHLQLTTCHAFLNLV